jgi:hypothetical protein
MNWTWYNILYRLCNCYVYVHPVHWKSIQRQLLCPYARKLRIKK